MTSEELYADVLRQTKEHHVFFDDVCESLPRRIQRLGERFRELLMLGGRIAVPVIVIDEGQPDLNTWTTDLCAEGKGILLQLLIIGVQGTMISLEDWCSRAGVSEEESILRLAVHEARHCLQRRERREIGWRGKQWWQRWMGENLHGTFRHLSALVHDPNALRAHARDLAGPRASRKNLHGHLLREHDAEATALACTASWRMTQNIRTVVRILHG